MQQEAPARLYFLQSLSPSSMLFLRLLTRPLFFSLMRAGKCTDILFITKRELEHALEVRPVPATRISYLIYV